MNAPIKSLFDTLSPVLTPDSTSRFFDEISHKVEISLAHAEARLEVLKMLATLRRDSERTAIILWSRAEEIQFMARLEEILKNPWEQSSQTLAQGVQGIVSEELARGVTRARLRATVYDLARPSSKDIGFNFPLVDDTTLVPLDLHLVFGPSNTVAEAHSRLTKQYCYRFDSIVYSDEDGTPQWLIRLSSLLWITDSNTRLADVALDIVPTAYPTLQTPKSVVEDQMNTARVNIFPIVDAKTGILNAILTREIISLEETRYYTAQLDTQIKESQLLAEVQNNLA